MIELALQEIAQGFWQKAGGYSSDFEFALTTALPLCLERLPGLTLTTARHWLVENNFTNRELTRLTDRPLRACLVALGGTRNFILLDARDQADEQLFSLAHEVAHFLLDYQLPRRQVNERLDATALQVLDGLRPPTFEERAAALLANVTLKPRFHFMERDATGNILSGQILQAENQADRLAIELLAPYEAALDAVCEAIKSRPTYATRWQAAQIRLIEQFGLPVSVAQPYARLLLTEAGGDQTVREWFGL